MINLVFLAIHLHQQSPLEIHRPSDQSVIDLSQEIWKVASDTPYRDREFPKEPSSFEWNLIELPPDGSLLRALFKHDQGLLMLYRPNEERPFAINMTFLFEPKRNLTNEQCVEKAKSYYRAAGNPLEMKLRTLDESYLENGNVLMEFDVLSPKRKFRVAGAAWAQIDTRYGLPMSINGVNPPNIVEPEGPVISEEKVNDLVANDAHRRFDWWQAIIATEEKPIFLAPTPTSSKARDPIPLVYEATVYKYLPTESSSTSSKISVNYYVDAITGEIKAAIPNTTLDAETPKTDQLKPFTWTEAWSLLGKKASGTIQVISEAPTKDTISITLQQNKTNLFAYALADPKSGKVWTKDKDMNWVGGQTTGALLKAIKELTVSKTLSSTAQPC